MKRFLAFIMVSLFIFTLEVNANSTSGFHSMDKGNQRKSTKQKKFKAKKAVKKKVPYKHKDPAYK